MAAGDLVDGGGHALSNEPLHVGVHGAVVLATLGFGLQARSSDLRVELFGDPARTGSPKRE